MASNERKCIAVIMSKPERKYQQGLLRGVCSAAFERGMNVAVFATSLLEGMEEYVWGEQKIFDLVQFEKFAGVVYAVGSFYTSDIIPKLNEKMVEVANSGIPVVAVDGQVEGLPCYFNDDADAVREVLEHLILEHNLDDIAFMTGRQGQEHAENALMAYRETMMKYDLLIDESREYYGDYWFNEADNFIEQLESSGKGLPQAVVCANEYMAIAMYKGLYKRGVYVPKHIRIGCTCNDSSKAPYLLNGENSLENVGREACNTIFRAMEGEAPEIEVKFFPCTNKLITNVGCGCQKASAYDYSEERGIDIDTDPGYFGESNFSRDGVLFKKDFYSLFKTLDGNTRYLKDLQGLYFCMCEGWDAPEFMIKDIKKNDYPERMQLCYSHEETENGPEVYVGEEKYFNTKDMFPTLFEDKGEPSVYIFRSLHFLDRNYGYVVMNNGSSMHVYETLFNTWIHDVTIGLESQCRLQSVNYMFYTDVMTGLYNRNGYNTFFPEIYEEAKKEGKQVLFALADLNFLKTVNDNYGHEEGDAAIKIAAKQFKNEEVEGTITEKNFRIGGDEFVKIAIGDFDEEKLEAFKNNLYLHMAEVSENSGKPYKIEMSLGYCYEHIQQVSEMEAMYSKADSFMYEEKLRLKGGKAGR